MIKARSCFAPAHVSELTDLHSVSYRALVMPIQIYLHLMGQFKLTFNSVVISNFEQVLFQAGDIL